MVSNKVCFPTNSFLLTSMIILFGVLGVFIYYKSTEENRFDKFCENRLNILKNSITSVSKSISDNLILPKSPIRIINETQGEILPERKYIGSNTYSISSQQVGYIYNNTNRFPLYENRQDNNYYYHIKDDSRNNVRIVVETSRNQQIYDNETITVPELGGDYTVKLYEYSENKYNPNIF